MNNSSPNINTSPMQDPPKKLKSSFEGVPVKSSFDNLGKAYSNNLYYNTGFGNSKYDEEFNFDSQFNELDPIGSINENRAQSQSNLAKIGAGIGRIGTKAATEVLKMPGVIGGIIAAPFAEEGEGWETAFNNKWIKSLSQFNEDINTELLPVYVKKAVSEGNLWDNISSIDFWATEGADGIGFIASMFAPGAALKSLNLGEKVLGTTAKGLSMINGEAKLAGAVRTLEGLGITANNIDLGAMTMANTLFESGAEAGSAMESFQKDLDRKLASGEIDQIKYDELQIQKARLGRDIFVSNLAILLVPNAIQTKMIWGKGVGSQLVKDTPSLMTKVGNRGKNVLGALGSEGFLEEGTQSTVETMFTDKANKGQLTNNMLNDFNIPELVSSYIDTLNTTDGQKAIFLGGFLGGGMAAYQGGKSDIATRKQTQNVLSLAEEKVGVFNRINETDVYKRDQNGEIIYNYNNQPQYDPVKVRDVAKALNYTEQQSQLFDQAIQEGNEQVIQTLKNEAINQLVTPFINKGELGIQALSQYLDTTLQTEEIANNEDAKTLKGKIIEQATYMQDQLNTYKDFSKSLINLNNSEATAQDTTDYYNMLGDLYINLKGSEYSQKEELKKLNVQKSKLLKDLGGKEFALTTEIVDENAADDMFKFKYEQDPRIKLINEQIEEVNKNLSEIDKIINEEIWNNEKVNESFNKRVEENNKLREQDNPENEVKVNQATETIANATTVEELQNLPKTNTPADKIIQQQANEKEVEIVAAEEVINNQEREDAAQEDNDFNNVTTYDGLTATEGSIITDELIPQEAENNTTEELKSIGNSEVDNGLGVKVISTDRSTGLPLQFISEQFPLYLEYEREPVNKSGKEVGFEINQNVGKSSISEIERIRQEELKYANFGNRQKEIQEGRENTKKIFDNLKQKYPANTLTGQVLRLLEKLIDINRISTISEKNHQSARGGKANGSAFEGGIILDSEIFDRVLNGEERAVKTFIHELFHQILNTSQFEAHKRGENTNLSSGQIKAWENLERLYEKAKNISNAKSEYGFTNLSEFLAEAFSNQGFQKELSNIKGEGKDTTLFKEILSSLLDFFKESLSRWAKKFNKPMPEINSGLLQDVMYWSEQLLDINKPYTPDLTTEEINAKYDAKIKALSQTKSKVNPKVLEALNAFNNKDFSNPKLLIDFLPLNVLFTNEVKAPIETRRVTNDINIATSILRTEIINHLIKGGSINDIKTTIQDQYKGLLKVDENKFVNNNILQLDGVKDLNYIRENLYVVNSFGKLQNILNDKTFEFNNDKIKPNAAGEIYLTIPQANGKLFPLKLNIKKISESEAVLLYEIYKEIITNEKSLDTTVSEVNGDLQEAILKSFEAELNIIGGNKNDIKLQEIIDLLIYQSANVKSQMQVVNGILYFGDKESTIDTIEQDQNDIINFLVNSKRHQIKINMKSETDNTKTNLKSNSADYLKYLVDNNILSTNAVVNEPTFQGYTNIYLNTGVIVNNQTKSEVEVQKTDIKRRKQEELDSIKINTADFTVNKNRPIAPDVITESVQANRSILGALNNDFSEKRINEYEALIKKSQTSDEQKSLILTELEKIKINAKYDAEPAVLNQPKISESDVEVKTDIEAKIKEVINNKEFIKLSEDGNSYINTKTGKTYKRVSNFISNDEKIDSNNSLIQSSLTIGTKVDELVRDFFADELKDLKEYDVSDINTISKFLEQLAVVKTNFKNRNEIVLANDIILYNDEIGVAGTVDLLTYDNQGNVRIYDMKTMRGNNFNEHYKGDSLNKYESIRYGKSKKQKHSEQISLYRILLNNTHGLKAKTIGVMPIEISYSPGDTTTTVLNLLKGVQLPLLDKVKTAELKALEEQPKISESGVEVIADNTGFDNLFGNEKTIEEKAEEVWRNNVDVKGFPKEALSEVIKRFENNQQNNRNSQEKLILSTVKDDFNNSPLLKNDTADFPSDIIRYIPRVLQEKAYENDKGNNPKIGGAGQTIQRIIERGGYSINEMDKLYPNWRRELISLNKIRNSQENFISLSEIPGTVENTKIKETQAEVFNTKRTPKERQTDFRRMDALFKRKAEKGLTTEKELKDFEMFKQMYPQEFEKRCN